MASLWASVEKVNSELFTLTYGSLVRQLLNDSEDCVDDVNVQLDKLGYNIGARLVDEYFAKTGGGRCLDFREAAEAVAKGGLKLFLGLNATCQNWAADGLSCSIVLDENPLADFVELPEQYSGLSYCNLLCGCIRGALEQASWRVTCVWEKDPLAASSADARPGEGASVWSLRLALVEAMPEHYPFKD